MRIERPRGTRDFSPDEMEKRRFVEGKLRKIAESFGYREILTPTFEHSELFKIKSGEGIVEEMYVFTDKSGRELALRPELTAPVMRMFVNECGTMPKPLRFYYFTNCFRYERPQKARYREFWQFGVELIGSNSYLADVEVIQLAYTMLKSLGIKFELNVGHVGILREILRPLGDNMMKAMRLIDKKDVEGLESYFREVGASPEIKQKVFEIMEAKGKKDVLEVVKGIISDEVLTRILSVTSMLEEVKVEFNVDLSIARGLDYYTGIVFECYAEGLGSQRQICGGGGYELASLFGGKETPATGFAVGFDRVCEIFSMKEDKKGEIVFFAPFKGFEGLAFKLASKLRENGFKAIVDVMERSIKKQLSFANDVGARFAIIIGEDEARSGEVTIKDLKTSEQLRIKISELTTFFSQIKRQEE